MKYLLLLMFTGCLSVPNFRYTVGTCAKAANGAPVMVLDRVVDVLGKSYYDVAVYNPLFTLETTHKLMISRMEFDVNYQPVDCPRRK